MNTRTLVILESPYAGDIETNIEYARACVRDSLNRGEAPIASHLLYTQPGILRDEVPAERQWGIDAGLAWRHVSEKTVVYTDRGITKGMEYGVDAARRVGKDVEFRSLPDFHKHDWDYSGGADSSGAMRECRTCGLVQRGSIPLAV